MRSTQRPDTLAQDQITPSSPISLATHRRSIHMGSIAVAASVAAIGSAKSGQRHPASYVSTGIRTAAHSWGTVHGKYG